jgi:hypothetical protein
MLALLVHHGSTYSSSSYSSLMSSEAPADGAGSGPSADAGSADAAAASDTSTGSGRGSGAFRAADGYVVTPPAGWRRDGDSKDKGTFTESRWHLAGSPQTFVLVDHSSGFTGSAYEGGSTVRTMVRRAAGYREYAWAAIDDTAWNWEFAADGQRKVDRFLTACGDGYAVLGAAPEEDFEDQRPTFEAFAGSLVPPCEQTGASGVASARSTGGPRAAAHRGPRNSPTNVVRRHLERIGDGNFAGAFSLLSSSYRASNANWIDQPSAAKPYIDVVKAGPSRISGRTASVAIRFYARDRVDTKRSDTKCRLFEGTAAAVKEGSLWRYEPSGNHYDSTVVSSPGACGP